MHVTEYCRPRRSDLPAAAGSAWNKISWRHQRDGMQGGGEVLGPRSVPRVNEAVRRLRPCRVSSPSAAAAAADDAAVSEPGDVDRPGVVLSASCGWPQREL